MKEPDGKGLATHPGPESEGIGVRLLLFTSAKVGAEGGRLGLSLLASQPSAEAVKVETGARSFSNHGT